jgi:type I restriction enzyme S subunit
MMFGLKTETIEAIREVLAKYPEVEKAILYGSRAIGNYRPGSDIDLTLIGEKLNLSTLQKIEDELDDLLLPYKIDLSLHKQIQNQELLEHIERVGKVFFDRNPASTSKPQNTNHLNEWKKVKIGDITKLVSRGIYPSYVNSEGITILNQKCIRGGKIDFSLSKLTSLNKSYNPEKKLQKCDILINSTGVGTAGRVSIFKSNIECYADTHISIVRVCKEKSDPEFIFYNLFGRENEIEGYAEGSTGQIELGRDIIRNLEILLPPLPEQQAIAEVLSSLDDKIDLLHRQNKTLEALAETLFRQWFVEEADEKWEKKSLGELLTITSSKRIFYSEYVSSGIPFYRSKEIIELRNTGSTASELYITNERFNEIDSKFGSPREGDILMTSVGTLGVAYRVKANEKFYFKDGNITWFKDFKGLPSSVVYLWLTSKIGQKELSAITIGSTQQALTIEGLKSISFKIPPKEIVSACEKQFDDIISKIDSNQAQIHTLTQLRDTLLPKLMSGEVRVDF